MRVKRLEIQGFKSFKDKTVIHFDHSITGIVGPNGCGKSNIVDAFFWVMGEQSYKHMRGNSSDDLIFNGSSKFSPLGMAEATMVLETDMVDTANAPMGASVQDIPPHLRTKEISVTRRLYRSGEGEYFMNGTLARLKDIQELFMDTGVGAKGYSVIEQGQIGKIVNAKPEERRLLIEEAAGIAKYKARKKESLRKMESAETNLSRLNDIIQEIEKNLATLDRQAQKARLYRKYKDELLEKEMTWGKRKRQVFTQKLESLKKQRDALEQEIVGLKAELQSKENSIEVDRIGLVTETKEAELLQTQIQQLNTELSQQRSALDLSRRRQGDLTSQLEALASEKEELEASIENDVQRLQEHEGDAEEADRLFQKAASEARQLETLLNQARKEVETSRNQRELSQRELRTSLSQISDLTSKSAALVSKVETSESQAEKLSQQIEVQNEKIAAVHEEIEKAKAAADEIRLRKESLNIERKEHSSRLQSEEQDLKQLERQRNDAMKSLTQLKSKLQSLEELDASYEGMADGPKAALDWAKAQGRRNEISALTDHLEVTHGYESVLESWLENRIENLIVQDSGLALSLLEKIRTEKQGRVSLQLMSDHLLRLNSSPKSDFKKVKSVLEKQNFEVLGQLADYVRTQGKNGSALQYLFDHVCVVESSANMNLLFESAHFHELSGWAIVSKDGVVLESHGMMRGGSLEATGASSILRRKRSIEELRTQTSESEAVYQKLEESMSTSKENIEISRVRLQTLQNDLQALEIQSAGLERDVHQTDRALQEAKKQYQSLQRDLEQIQSEIESARSEKEDLDYRLQDLITSRTELEENISTSDQGLLDRESELRKQENEFQTLRVNEASLRERAVSLRRELEATRSLITDRERRLKEVLRTLDRASNEQAEFSGGESELAEKIEELTLTLGNARDHLASIKDKIEQSNSKVNSTLERIKELHKLGDHKTTESNHLALELERISGELSHLILNLEEKYGPGCLDRPSPERTPPEDSAELEGAQASPAVPAELSPEEEIVLGEEVERLRERIRRLGEVNVMAIEEYDQLKKRFDHLSNEKQDLERSMENLKEAIEHINKTSEDRFRKAFTAIAERFERLFPIIFGGGQAKLSLVFPEGSTDILEAGVDILAQPPGKKIANITLLSGGEKALTAVSLIFAIFMVKPSPFCVLDEVDAPLDDANIGKFNALLREMSVKSQFILITHNKKTMELNDTLYGVTMEEPGVSKMVSIEMR